MTRNRDGRRRPVGRILALAAAAVLALTACASGERSEFGVQPAEVREDLVRTDVQIGTELAPGLIATARVDLGGVHLVAGDAVIGLAEADESSALTMAAVSSGAEPRWQVETSPSCTAFAVSAADGEAIAVFMDARPATDDSGRITETVATAFRVSDGERLWGPVPVPGPLLADAGLVFYAQPDAPIADVSGTTVMLDPATGRQRFSAGDGIEIIGEYDGIGVIRRDGALEAVELAGEEPLWAESGLERPEGVSESAAFEPASMREAGEHGYLVGAWVDGEDRRPAVYALDSGLLLASPEGQLRGEAAADGEALYLETRSGDEDRIAAVDSEGVRWEAPVADGATLASAGDGRVHLRLGGLGIVLDATDGAELARGDFRVPEHVFPDGAALITTAGELWLAEPDD
ncbi:hypothetical protein [Gulosibacter sp. 10]|uniref:hypothetical protein n=1 Tax=Gulosibacter sp. 10 TaxID=1255570 RepID=UPI00097EAD97|nr:hypothetical protein [Gulosibacter sp. 10]SJM64661.1 hypothetical protein FM112_10405 [Gulosibacter sp. 10]